MVLRLSSCRTWTLVVHKLQSAQPQYLQNMDSSGAQAPECSGSVLAEHGLSSGAQTPECSGSVVVLQLIKLR